MSNIAIYHTIRIPRDELDKSTHRHVLLLLADCANEEGYCWPKFRTLADWTAISEHRVRMIVKDLEEWGWLKKVERRKRRDGSWGSWILQITVVPTESESTDPTDEIEGVPTHGPSTEAETDRAPTHIESTEGPCVDAQSDRAPTHAQEPPVEPPVTTEPPTRRDSEFKPVVYELCELFADSVPERIQGAKRKNVTKAWLTDMDRLIRLDKRDPEEIRRVINWLVHGRDKTATWWASIIQSPRNLRSNWDTMAGQVQRNRQQRDNAGREWQESLSAAAERIAAELDVG